MERPGTCHFCSVRFTRSSKAESRGEVGPMTFCKAHASGAHRSSVNIVVIRIVPRSWEVGWSHGVGFPYRVSLKLRRVT